jgi:flagellar biosynthesis/type III secretory pathway protein FliH
MLYTEWNWDDAKAVWQEEAREEGWEGGLAKGWEGGLRKGREEDRQEILELINAGYTAEALKERLLGNKSAGNRARVEKSVKR